MSTISNSSVFKCSRTVCKVLLLLALLSVLFGVCFLFRCHHPSSPPRDLTKSWRHRLPSIGRTSGALLEVGTLTVAEDFTDARARYHLGVYFGSTQAAIQVLATYRYDVPLVSPEWSMKTRGPVCVVTAPAPTPAMPVAYDSAKTLANAENGWACWDKGERLNELRATVTSRLGERAGDPAHVDLVREACRRTVAEFVARWLVEEHGWKDDPYHQVIVRFSGEDPVAPRL